MLTLTMLLGISVPDHGIAYGWLVPGPADPRRTAAGPRGPRRARDVAPGARRRARARRGRPRRRDLRRRTRSRAGDARARPARRARGRSRPPDRLRSTSAGSRCRAPCPAAGVSTMTSLPAARHTSAMTAASIWPEPKLACRSAPESNASRLSLAWTRSMRPVMARTRSTMPDEVLAAGVGVTGVEAEPDAELAHRVPQPGQPVEAPGHGVVAAGGVLDEQLDREPVTVLGRPGEGLAPVVDPDGRIVAGVDVSAVHDQGLRPDIGGRRRVLAEQLAAGDADAVVGRRDVEDVRRVDVDGEVGAADGVGVRVLDRLLPALRVGEEELDGLRAVGRGGGQRVGRVDVGPDGHAGGGFRHVNHPTFGVGHVLVVVSATPLESFSPLPAG